MVDEDYIAKVGDECTMLGFTEGRVSDRTSSYSNLRFVDSTIADFNECNICEYFLLTHKIDLFGKIISEKVQHSCITYRYSTHTFRKLFCD